MYRQEQLRLTKKSKGKALLLHIIYKHSKKQKDGKFKHDLRC